MFCVAPGLAATTHPTGVLGAVSSPAVEASGAAPLVYLTTYTLRISTNRVKSAEVPTNVKEVVARFVTVDPLLLSFFPPCLIVARFHHISRVLHRWLGDHDVEC